MQTTKDYIRKLLLETAQKAGAGEETIAKIQAQADEAQKTLDELTVPEEPELYVLTRDEDVGFQFFKSDSSIVSSIAKVFPIFFFLVAALVCVTTMTRMMNEQRTQIGVLKSMGYGNRSVIMKYMLYSGSSGILGCLIGYFVGTVCSYFLNGRITFRDGHIARWRQCLRFVMWNVVSLGVSEVMIGLLTHFGLNPYIAKVGVTLEVALFNYFGYKYIVFAVPKQTEGEQDHDRSSTD